MNIIKYFPYSKKFPELFQKEKVTISEVLKDVEIHHVGSTAVPNLGGKGVIDVLIAIENWNNEDEVIEKLRNLGFTHIHPKEEERVFLSRIGPTQFGDIHIHLVVKDGEPYRELLSFRDYLRSHEDEVMRYSKLKLEWLKKGEDSRDKYGRFKEIYLKEALSRIKDN